VLKALADAAVRHPFDRKLIVCRRATTGREVLRALSLAGIDWVGFEATTSFRLAHELAGAALSAVGLVVVDELEEVALMEAAMDQVLDGAAGRLAALADASGLRQAIMSSVRSLRLAGITAADVRAARLRDPEKREQVAAILAHYEAGLADGGRVDAAGVLRAALAGDSAVPGRVLILPDAPVRGLQRLFVQRLLSGGAELLRPDPVHGLPRPAAWPEPPAGEAPEPRAAAAADAATPLAWVHAPRSWAAAARGPTAGYAADGRQEADEVVLDVFAAASAAVELREVLRRVIAAGLRWDEVEIIATDAATYGVALDALCRRLGIPVGHAAGLPLARTRVGRAVAKYLEWVQHGFPADGLRRMLERGDVALPGAAASASALARQLRRMRVGAGIEALEQAAGSAAGSAAATSGAATDDTDATERTERPDGSGLADGRGELAVLLQRLADGAPRAVDGRLSAGDLARGLLSFVPLVPVPDAVERAARSRITERLRRVAAMPTRTVPLAGAIAAIQARLDQVVPAPESDGASPWVAAGGHLHLSDLDTGGWSGRRATFLVGLDSGRVPGPAGTDALLVDDDRRRLNREAEVPPLALAAERLEERRYAFAALVARLRGRVTFSFAAWDAVEGRTLAPASELLQVHRLMSGDAAADYESLHAAVRPPVSAVPRGSVLLDGADAWLRALAEPEGEGAPGALRRGVAAVCAAWPGLAAGAEAWRSLRPGTAPGAAHGVITPRAMLDPRRPGAAAVSAKQLEALGACPRRYLLRYVLAVRVPDDEAAAPGAWLSPRERGVLLHRVFETALRPVLTGELAVDDAGFADFVAGALDSEVAAVRRAVPPPGETVFDIEREALRDDVNAFVAMVRADAPRLVALEQRFGRDGLAPVPLVFADGRSVLLEGAIDRVDELPDGRLLIVDYKTGASGAFGRGSGALDGGRRLQHVLYAAAAAHLFGREIAGAEYQFPTGRSENHRARYDAPALARGPDVLAGLLDLVSNGWFVPTADAEDCRHCDYRAVCRVRTGPWGRMESRLVEWAGAARGPGPDLLRGLRR
jgi:hypothetical protein